MAMSSLLDLDPQAKITEYINYIGAKNMKIMHLFETLRPERSEEIR